MRCSVNKGFVILAQNTRATNYVRCAEVLAHSIKEAMPEASVSLISDNKPDSKIFDNVIKLPYGDQALDSDWKLINDWQVYEASPYEHTIKLEADMYLPRSIDYWWDILMPRELVISTTIRDFKQQISEVKGYRKFIYANELPDTYNAITYFKKSELAKEFFSLVKIIFENWDEFRKNFKCNPDEPATTDWVYAIASHVLGVEKTTLPQFKEMSMIHMKQFIIGTPVEDWTDIFVYEILDHCLRINTIPQMYPFHYQIKDFSNKLMEKYDEQ